jgi:Mg/Co/Ni transporter MgtE
MKSAQQIMSDRYVQAGPDWTVGRSLRSLLDNSAALVAIIDSQHHLCGILPNAVMLRAAIDSHLRQDPVSLHMLRRFATVTPDAPADWVLEQFVLHNLNVVPVVEEGQLLGVVERLELLRGVLDSGDPVRSRRDPAGDVVWL